MRLYLMVLGLVAPIVVWSGEAIIPHEFVSGEKAVAAEVNENFSILADEINDNNSRINANSSAVSSNTDDISGKQNKVTGVCNVGSAIREINVDGTVVCETDDVGTSNAGDITAVNTATGSGLEGGAVSGTVNLTVDTDVIQQKITGAACAVGQFVASIAADGTAVCSTPVDTNSGGDITEVVAGNGLTGGGDSGSVTLDLDTTSVQTAITGECINGEAVTSISADGTTNCSDTRNYVSLADATTTTKYAYFSRPADWSGGSATVTPIFGSCNGFSVRLSFNKGGFNIGNNTFTILDPDIFETLNIGTTTFGYVIASANFSAEMFDVVWFRVARLGDHVDDTCTNSLTLYGVRIQYSSVFTGGLNRFFIPAHVMTNQ